MIARFIGLMLLLGCALSYAPEGTNPRILGALVLPATAAIGLWLILPNPVLLAGCIFALAAAHSQIGVADLFDGTLYPGIALISGALLVRLLMQRQNNWQKNAKTSDTNDSTKPPPPPADGS